MVRVPAIHSELTIRSRPHGLMQHLSDRLAGKERKPLVSAHLPLIPTGLSKGRHMGEENHVRIVITGLGQGLTKIQGQLRLLSASGVPEVETMSALSAP